MGCEWEAASQLALGRLVGLSSPCTLPRGCATLSSPRVGWSLKGDPWRPPDRSLSVVQHERAVRVHLFTIPSSLSATIIRSHHPHHHLRQQQAWSSVMLPRLGRWQVAGVVEESRGLDEFLILNPLLDVAGTQMVPPKCLLS